MTTYKQALRLCKKFKRLSFYYGLIHSKTKGTLRGPFYFAPTFKQATALCRY